MGWSALICNRVKAGAAPMWDITDRIKRTWRRSTRAIGGYWIGTCEYEGTRDDLLEMFLEGIMREVREQSGGMITWQGYIAEMELQLRGVRYIRSMLNLANAVKMIYTQIGNNMLTNGGGESGAWTAATGVGGTTGAATITQDTTWISTGRYSIKIVSAGGIEGAWVQGSGYAITIVAGQQYDITGVLNVTSGSWRISCNRSDTDASLAHDSTRAALGERKVSMTIPKTNTYAGTVDLRITSEGAAGTIYADTFAMQTSPLSSQTGWRIDQNSINEYGRNELALLEASMTWSAAVAKILTTLKKQAWVKTLPPSEFTLIGADLESADSSKQDKLTLTVHGYSHTLANKYSLTVGTAAASTHVRSIVGEAEFVLPGSIKSNTLDYQIDNRGPIKHWQILQDITKAGDASGNRWVCGVYAHRLLNYGIAANDITAHYRGGRFYHPTGSELEPWFAEPGHLLHLDDAPVVANAISGHAEDDPRTVFISEVEMGPATEQYPMGTLTMKHEDLE